MRMEIILDRNNDFFVILIYRRYNPIKKSIKKKSQKRFINNIKRSKKRIDSLNLCVLKKFIVRITYIKIVYSYHLAYTYRVARFRMEFFAEAAFSKTLLQRLLPFLISFATLSQLLGPVSDF